MGRESPTTHGYMSAKKKRKDLFEQYLGTAHTVQRQDLVERYDIGCVLIGDLLGIGIVRPRNLLFF